MSAPRDLSGFAASCRVVPGGGGDEGRADGAPQADAPRTATVDAAAPIGDPISGDQTLHQRLAPRSEVLQQQHPMLADLQSAVSMVEMAMLSGPGANTEILRRLSQHLHLMLNRLPQIDDFVERSLLNGSDMI